MTVYDILSQIKISSFSLFGSDAFQLDISALDNESDKHIFNLVRDVCGLHIKISDKDVEFQPSAVLMGKRSFSLQDMTEDDYTLLESLDFSLLPVNIRARIADLLWTEKKNFADALIAIDSYMALFDLLFSDDEWLDSLDMIRRALCISTQIKQVEKHDKACKMIYDHILRINGTGDLFMSLHLIKIVIKEKYGESNVLISILDKIIQKSDVDVLKTEMAYKLMRECYKWNKDTQGIFNTNVALAQYYEKKAGELADNDFRSLVIAEGYLKKATFLYRNNREPEQAERVQKQLVLLQSKIPQTMGVIQRHYDVSKLHKYMVGCFDGLTFQEALLRLIQFTIFPSKEDVKKEVLTEVKKYPISHLVKKTFGNATGQTILTLEPLDINNPESDQQLLDAHIHQKYLQHEKIEGDLYLKRALGIIRDKYEFQLNDLDILIASNPIIPQGRERIFRSAIYMALTGQEYEAIHILASQVENLFRDLARELGALTVTLENDGTSKEKVLTSVFDLPELIDAYDNDILFLFEGLLNEQAGANIRNNVAHGLLTEALAQSGVCVFFICAVIRLLSYTSLECINIFNHSPKIQNLKLPSKDIMPVLSS